MLIAISKASNLLGRFLPLVILIGLLRINIQISPVTVVASAIGMVVALCLEISLYAKIVSFVKDENLPSIPAALKQNAVNYIVVLVVLAVPTLCLQVFLRSINAPGIEAYIAKNAVSGLISCLAIYVFPIIFIKSTNLSAIPVGVAYLVKSLGFSFPLFGLVLLRYAIVALPLVAAFNFSSNITVLLITGIAANIFATALMVLVFASATYVICGDTQRGISE